MVLKRLPRWHDIKGIADIVSTEPLKHLTLTKPQRFIKTNYRNDLTFDTQLLKAHFNPSTTYVFSSLFPNIVMHRETYSLWPSIACIVLYERNSVLHEVGVAFFPVNCLSKTFAHLTLKTEIMFNIQQPVINILSPQVFQQVYKTNSVSRETTQFRKKRNRLKDVNKLHIDRS